jgi:hypothetical protein
MSTGDLDELDEGRRPSASAPRSQQAERPPSEATIEALDG